MIVDQHFQQRNRLGRLLSLIAQNPSLLGLGVDEDTAGVVGPDQVMEVIGRGSITVVDGAASETDAWEIRGHRPLMISGVVLHSLPAGYRFDLRRRVRVAAPTLHAIQGGEIASSYRGDSSSGGRGWAPRVHSGTQHGTRGGPVAQADPAPRTRTRAASNGDGRKPPSRRKADGPAPRAPSPPSGSSRRASCAAPTTGRASRSSARSSTSGCSRSSRATRSRASSTRWSSMLPTLEDHACSLGRRGGFITRLREGTWVGHVAEHIALEFQNLAGTDVRHGKTRGTGEYGRYNVIFEYREEQVGIEAGKAAVGLVNHLVAPSDPAVAFDLMAELEKLIRLAERLAFGPSTQALLDEAAGRDIPYIRLDRFSLVQLGQGVHQQRIRATMTSRTERHRRRHRVGQEAHQPPPGLGGTAGSPLRGRRDRGRGRRGREAPRLPVRASSRSTATTAAASP